MKNRDLEATWAYHNGTKHSYESIRTNRHYLDWENQPIPFKIYSQLEPISLPQQLSSSGMTALEAISASRLRQKIKLFPRFRPWRKFSIYLQESPSVGAIRGARYFFARRPVPARSIISISISSAAICQVYKQEFITLARRTLP